MFNFGAHKHRRRHKPPTTVSPNPLLLTREKDKERYYLLPGMGGKAYRQKQNRILKASIAVGLLVSLALGLLFYFIQSSPK